MISVGDHFPQFSLKAVNGGMIGDVGLSTAFTTITNNSYPEKWKVIFFYPKDFTFICPTEITEFANLDKEFKSRDAQLLSVSTDSEFVHWSWRKHQKELNDLPFPMVSDIKRELSSALEILDKNEGVAQRAVFIVDPSELIRFSMITDLSVGRNPKEVLRVLDALQTDELCPCNWEKGQSTIDISNL